MPLTSHGLHDATTDADVIRQWWEETPDANVGIATGPPGPTVVDCDGPIGRHEWLKFIDGIGWEDTPWCCTTNGGWHIYFAGDDAIRNKAGWLRKVDARGLGGYCVAPPSVGASGGAYWWVAGPDERTLAPIPGIVHDVLTPVLASTVRSLRSVRSVGDGYARAALAGELSKVRAAPIGKRNHTLCAAAFSLAQLVATGALDREHVISHLFNTACASGLSEVETLRTIASGMRAGTEKPRHR